MMFAFKRHITEWRLVILQAQEKIFVLQMKQPWRNLIGNSIQVLQHDIVHILYPVWHQNEQR